MGSDAYDKWTSTYDAFGRLESRMDPSGTITFYDYDALNRPIAMKVSSTAGGATEVTVSETFYDSNMPSQGSAAGT